MPLCAMLTGLPFKDGVGSRKWKVVKFFIEGSVRSHFSNYLIESMNRGEINTSHKVWTILVNGNLFTIVSHKFFL